MCLVPDDFVRRPWRRRRIDLAKSGKHPTEKAPPGRGFSRDETWGSSETHGPESAAKGVGIRTARRLCRQAYRRPPWSSINVATSIGLGCEAMMGKATGSRLQKLQTHREHLPCRSVACWKIMYLDRTRSRSSPLHSKTPCARCAWLIEPTPQPRSLPERLSSSPSKASAIPSVCANARFNFYRNRASRPEAM